MASIRTHKSGKLYIDFRFCGERFRETSLLTDSPGNRKRLGLLAQKIDAEITLGSFDYKTYFPESPNVAKAQLLLKRASGGRLGDDIPTFEAMSRSWLAEHEVEWRCNYKNTITSLFEKHIIPQLGEHPVDAITREDLVAFRNGRVRYRTSGGLALLNGTINRMMTLVKAVIEEASHQYKFVSPFERIKKLKEEMRHVEPFTIDEMNRILGDVRADFRDYLIVKFFTGLRTSEIHGLRWKCIDFDRNEIKVRETFSKAGFEYTKNDASQREIRMSSQVLDAIKRQQTITGAGGREGLVFCNRKGQPIDDHNFCNRVWRPMLEDLGIPYRRPYDTRHTAATLMVAAGESPEWVARQLGHANTKMLFTVYSKFVPNLTRNDGSALDRLLTSSVNTLKRVDQ
jgi:integrase